MNLGNIAGLVSAPLKTKGWNFVRNTLTSTAVSLVSPSTIIGPSNNNLTITAGSFPVTATARRPRTLNIIGANSVGSPDYNVSNGIINILAGNATFNTQTTNGGNIIIKAGLSNSYLGSTSGDGGSVEISAGTGGDGNNANVNGYLLIYTPDALANGVSATSSGYTPGDITIQAGGANHTAANTNNGAALRLTTRMGSSRPNGYTAAAANGGPIVITLGTGGSAASTVTGIGGNGGSYTISGGAGGNATGAGGTHTGGTGSAIIVSSGVGGTATSASGTRTGGNSGSITLSTGQGGAGTTVNGDSGSITISTGLAGAGAGSAGTSGSILFNTGSTNQITISPARTTITNEAKIERAAVLETSSTSIQLDVTNYAGMVINCTATSAVTITLPTTNVPVGYNVVVIRSGTGTITFVEGTVTVGGAANVIRSYNSLKSIDGVNSVASLICLKSGSSGVSAEYNLSGSLIA